MDHKKQGCGLVVIIEDDQINRELLQEAIESEGYEVRTASNGEEAFSLLNELNGKNKRACQKTDRFGLFDEHRP